jgi:hypothetical protein
VLGLGDDPPITAPAGKRAPEEVGEAADGTALGRALDLGRGEIFGDGTDQARVAREAEDVVDAVRLAPRHELVRAKPESARSRILTCGHRARIWPTMRATSSLAPADASRFERRSLAASRCRPQST